MEHLPEELIISEIFQSMSGKDIINLCRSNRNFKRLCDQKIPLLGQSRKLTDNRIYIRIYKEVNHIEKDIKVLEHAARRGHLKALKVALKLGLYDDMQLEFALNAAVRMGHVEIVENLIQYGANPTRGLFIAISYNQPAMAKLLLELGAQLYMEGDLYFISMAARIGSLDIVKYLVEHGADVNVNDNEPIQDAVRYEHHDIVRYLMDHGAETG